MNDRKTKASLSLDSELKEIRELYGCNCSAWLPDGAQARGNGRYLRRSQLGGWDTHTTAFDTLSNRLLPELDKG